MTKNLFFKKIELKKYCIVASSDFINNNAGGTQVIESNINTILAKETDLCVYFLDFKNRKIIRKQYFQSLSKNILSSSFKYPSIGRYGATIIKTLLFFYLALKNEFILSEHFYSLPTFKITPRFIRNKIIYSHHDFLFEIKALRDQSNKEYLKKIELDSIKKCKAVISGNFKEAEIIKGLGIPTLYLPINTTGNKMSLEFDFSSTIYHLGSFNTTASKLGFLHFQNEILPYCDKDIKTILIGQDSDLYSTKELIKGLGFVDNLSDFLKKGSINVIQWKYGTGQRTRVFESISRGNIIVSYKVLGEIIPELVSGKNCILVNDELQFASAINNLCKDHILRQKISNEAIQLSSYFSLENRVLKFQNFFEFLTWKKA